MSEKVFTEGHFFMFFYLFHWPFVVTNMQLMEFRAIHEDNNIELLQRKGNKSQYDRCRNSNPMPLAFFHYSETHIQGARVYIPIQGL